MKNIFILTICSVFLFSCGGKGKKNQTEDNTPKTENAIQSDTHNAKNSLDYVGLYHGVLPSASGEGIDMHITLQDDGTYLKEVAYIGKSKEPIKSAGTYSWNEEGNTITLNEEEKPNQYFVGENTLTHLDINGQKIEGELASSYILKKE